jgi:hypothetical protein
LTAGGEWPQWVVRGTIWLALAAFVAAEGGRWRARRTGLKGGWALAAFASGAVLCALHFAAALHWTYGWSHTRALEATARQTEEVYGLSWGGGLWVNYVFLAAWMAELIRWSRDPSYALRAPRAGQWALRGFYALVVVNAAVVFPQGAAR